MNKQEIKRLLKMYTGGACVMTANQFAFYANQFALYDGITGVEATQKLREANVKELPAIKASKASTKWFISDIADKIVKNML